MLRMDIVSVKVALGRNQLDATHLFARVLVAIVLQMIPASATLMEQDGWETKSKTRSVHGSMIEYLAFEHVYELYVIE